MSEKAEELEERLVFDDQLADVMDAINNVARKLALRGQDIREIREAVPLTGTEVEVLREVLRSPGATPTQIAAATGLRRSNVSAAVRVLESRDFITKEQSAEDARYVRLTATEFAIESTQSVRALWVRRLRAAVPEELLEQTVTFRETLMALDQALRR
ncbi:MarR family winged helix-turn-helix transcriptional regulator [Nocardia macrotermitis]|uniref:MarR family winged helix-turn-helix transcriptional regulator n=1 Tax=Nocardia macrotermitis TaxID=2585198 RepID=UPI001885F770|nr:helix-turn-helix domain-containing protein [Nocardia macrotermitis]